MNRFVIADGLPYLLANGKTYAVRWDHKGFTVGMEVKLASIPTITHGELAIHAKCAGRLDSISVPDKVLEPEQEQKEQEQPEQEREDQEEIAILDGMTVAQLKAYAKENGIDLGEAKKKADILAVIKNAKGQDVIDNDTDG